MISKGYLSSYSAWTDIQMVKVLEDTSESLSKAQKQEVVDKAIMQSNNIARKYGYNKTFKIREIKEGTNKYKNAIKYDAYKSLSSNPKSVFYYKTFINGWNNYKDPYNCWLVFDFIEVGITSISYCFVDRDGYTDLCIVRE